MASFIAELKRRRVVRVALLYAIVGWLVIQIADVVIPALRIPAWGLSFIVVFVALGAPIALVLAWAYELTPEGIRRTRDVGPHESARSSGRTVDFAIIAVLAAVLVYMVVDKYLLRDRTAATGQAPTHSPVASIAVLPFIDMSATQDQEYFTDGMSEEMLNLLAQVEGFRVAGRTSAFSFKGRDDDLRVIGTKLGVENVLEGSVRKQGDRIRVTAQLVKVADGYHLWSDSYDRKLDDVFAIQTDIATQVVAELRKKLLGPDSHATTQAIGKHMSTRNVEAYTRYLRGQHLLRPRNREGMEAALEEFERAAELDPGFAAAHVGIANSLLLLESYKQRSLASVEPRVTSAIERALELDPNAGEALALRALLLRAKGAPASEQLPLLDRAVALSPSDTQAFNWLAQAYGSLGQANDEVRIYERAYEIDPLAPVILQNYALAIHRRGDRAQAQRLLHELEVLLPASTRLYSARQALAFQDGDLVARVRWGSAAARLDPRSVVAQFELSVAYADLGDVTRAERHASNMIEIDPGSTLGMMLHVFYRLQAGDLQAATEWLRRAQAMRPSDQEVLIAATQVYEANGDFARALESLLRAFPSLGTPTPEFDWNLSFFVGPQAVFLLRKTGDAAQARVIERAMQTWLEEYWKPLTGKERPDSLTVRVLLATAMGDRERLITTLNQLYDSGGALSAWYPKTTWFKPFRQDPAIEPLLAQHERRRTGWRRQLVAEGL